MLAEDIKSDVEKTEAVSDEKSPKISVIVPVYKVEKYLPECIESVLAQTFTDFELILVDDGSPDNSGKICDDYAKKDSRIRVFHKENGGVSSARNLGLCNAHGEWITFLDSDDSFPLRALEDLLSATKDEIDLVEGNSEFPYESVSGFEYAKKLAKHNNQWRTSPWAKLIRRGVCASEDVLTPKWMVMGEDFLMCLRFSRKIRSAVRIPKDVYHYRIHPESICKKFSLTVDYFRKWYDEVEKSVLQNGGQWKEVGDILLVSRYGSLFLYAKDFSLRDPFVLKILERTRIFAPCGWSSRLCVQVSFLPRVFRPLSRMLIRGVITSALYLKKCSFLCRSD